MLAKFIKDYTILRLTIKYFIQQKFIGWQDAKEYATWLVKQGWY